MCRSLHCYVMKLYIGALFELASDEGLIDIVEGEVAINFILTNGFSYGAVPIRVSTLTYSEFTERGYNLADHFDSDDIPVDAADGMPLLHIITTLEDHV